MLCACLTLHRSFFATPTDYAFWSTNVTNALNANFTSEFLTLYQDPTRTGFAAGTQYSFHVSYRPETGYMRVWVANAATGVRVQDTGDIWDPTSINVCSSMNHMAC